MEKKLTKSQLMTLLSEAWNVSKKDAESNYNALVSLVYKQVDKGGEIALPGLGKLEKKSRAARAGRNPATGETIQIPAKTVLKFRVTKAAKDALL